MDRDELLRRVDAYFVTLGGAPTCPICHTVEWNLDALAVPPAVNENDTVQLRVGVSLEGLWVLPFVCKTCGYTLFFHADRFEGVTP